MGSSDDGEGSDSSITIALIVVGILAAVLVLSCVAYFHMSAGTGKGGGVVAGQGASGRANFENPLYGMASYEPNAMYMDPSPGSEYMDTSPGSEYMDASPGSEYMDVGPAGEHGGGDLTIDMPPKGAVDNVNGHLSVEAGC